MKRLAVFASGSGTNAENLIRFFQNSSIAKIELVLCNRPDAYVIQRAKNLNIPVVVFNRAQFYQTKEVFNILKENSIDLIVLAGFLWLVPENIVTTYPKSIVNIHPALLPKFGGKGMFGQHVHNAVVANKEVETGITIHLIDQEYDKGHNLFQATCPVLPSDSADDVAAKIHELEYEHFPKVIDKYLKLMD